MEMEKVLNYIKNPIIITIAIILLTGGGLVYALRSIPKEDKPSAPYVEKYWGKSDAKITVTEYADFNCPGCRVFAESTEKQLKEKYSDKIKFVYKHFPLKISGHETSQKAAEASEAAGTQGKFWEYHDLLFSRQSEGGSWNTEKLTDYSKELGLDTEKFKKELADDYYRKVVKDSAQEAVDKSLTGTPSILINDQKIEGQNGNIPTFEDLQKEIDKKLGN